MHVTYKNILIVRTDRIGDVVLTTPAIRALRQSYPESRISILVTPITEDIVKGNECIDEVIVDDRQKEHKGLRGYINLVQTLRRKKFDLAIIYHTKKRTNLTCFLAGIPVRMGYKNNKFGFLLNWPVSDVRHKGERHEAQYCLDVLKALGVQSDDLKLDLPVDEQSFRWVEQSWKKHGITDKDRLVAIHPGASDPAKRWPDNRFAQLMDILIEQYSAKIFIIGNSDTGDTSKSIISLLKGNAIDLTGNTTIGQLAGLLARCDLLVSNDSGPVHIAAGVGTPVVSIFTRNQPGINPQRWRPLGEKSRVVSVKPFQSDGVSFRKAQAMDVKYLELIETAEVLEAVDSIFKLC